MAFRRTVATILIALLALAAFTPSAYRHTHSLSDHSKSKSQGQSVRVAHRHGAHSHGRRHSHSHGGHSHSHDHSQAATTHSHLRVGSLRTAADTPVAHIHLAFLGFELTLPVPGDESSPVPADQGEWVSVASDVAALQLSDVGSPSLIDAAFVGEPPLTVLAPPSAEPFVPPKLILLCDTARRERSGVLNI